MYTYEDVEDRTINVICVDCVNAIKGVRGAKNAAMRVYDVLYRHSMASGQQPDIEVLLRKEGNMYRVSWESVPHEWAVPVSLALTATLQGVVEPYYSFDLCFYTNERYGDNDA